MKQQNLNKRGMERTHVKLEMQLQALCSSVLQV